ncbi:hypothetical protein NIES208_01615 [[Limnothrix rosea] IAM M-220]|nr:hypothetical protein NIES208_01615 [[Limnothrix rosea] IAM M-220]
MRRLVTGQVTLNVEQENQLLGYPEISEMERQARRQELESFGIEKMLSMGKQSLRGLQILGLGYVGLVVLVIKDQQLFALKIRRTNGKNASLLSEAEVLRQVNQWGIAPRVYQGSQNFILMDFIDGQSFLDWLQKAIANKEHHSIYQVLDNLIEQAFRLDQMGLDRDDMRCITKDVIVTPKHHPVLLDFSGASGDRRPQNVTALVQGLFWGSVVARYLQPLFPHCNRGRLVPLLRHYKIQQNRANFDALKQAIALPDLS